MVFILKEPRPRPRVKLTTRTRLPGLGICKRLPVPRSARSTSFDDVLNARISSRRLRQPTWVDIGSLLWLGARTRETLSTGAQHRASPSAGGIHPIEILVLNRSRLYLYDAIVHGVRRINVPPTVINHLESVVSVLAPNGRGTVLVFAAHMKSTSAKYVHALSLVWRDAGAILATLGLCAASLDLGFCCLGVLGTETVASLYGDRAVVAAGVCMFGRR